MSIAKIYCKEVHKNFSKYFGNWEPSEPIKLGDIGYLEGDMFIHVKNISSMGIGNLNIDKAVAVGNKKFMSRNNVSVKLLAKGDIQGLETSAGLEINFKKGNALFINALNCTAERYSDKDILGKFVLDCYKKNKTWDKNWVIVTDVISAENTTIVISENANSSVLLKASTEVSNIDSALANASLSFTVVTNNNVGYCNESCKNTTPFFCLSGIKVSLLKKAEFTPQIKYSKVSEHRNMSHRRIIGAKGLPNRLGIKEINRQKATRNKKPKYYEKITFEDIN